MKLLNYEGENNSFEIVKRSESKLERQVAMVWRSPLKRLGRKEILEMLHYELLIKLRMKEHLMGCTTRIIKFKVTLLIMTYNGLLM